MGKNPLEDLQEEVQGGLPEDLQEEQGLLLPIRDLHHQLKVHVHKMNKNVLPLQLVRVL